MFKAKPTLLLAEDDPHLGALLTEYLEREGFSVECCPNGELALKTFQRKVVDMCLLDIMMPHMDGFSLAAAIRMKNKTIPILFITARSLKEDKLKAYGLGADDYITKPFDVEELLWKIRAVLRRIPDHHPVSPPTPVAIGKYQFHVSNQSLYFEGELKRMTEKECEILAYLATHRNTVVKRDELLKAVWGENDYFLGRSLDVFITKIRKYLRHDSSIRIENVFGVGFILTIPA